MMQAYFLAQITLEDLNNPIAIGVILFLILLVWRLFNTAGMYLGSKRFVKKTKRLRRRKFNGPDIIEFTSDKRKRDSNSYKKLRRRAKNRVLKYFEYKQEELPGITNYAHGKLLRRNRQKLLIYVSNGQKKITRFKMKKAAKQFIDITNKYQCLDDLVEYLHNLPKAILSHKEYEIQIPEHGVAIGYEIK
jgi:phage terminase large subunit-like protein